MGEAALIPRDVIRNRRFVAACAATLMMSAVFFASVLYAPQFMEKILGYSALKAGVGMLPMLGLFALVSLVAAPVYERIGAKLTISAGAVCLAVGPFLLSRAGVDATYGTLVPGLAVTGLGVGLFYSAITTAGVTALDPSRSSLAGGLIYMFQIAGGAIGLGITTTIFTLASESDLDSKAAAHGADLTDQQVSILHGLLAGTDSAQDALSQLSSSVHTRVLDIVDDSFVHGLQVAFRYVAVVALIGLFISVLFVGGSPGASDDSAT